MSAGSMVTRSRWFGWMLVAVSLGAPVSLVGACGARSSLLDSLTHADGSGAAGAGGDAGTGQAGGGQTDGGTGGGQAGSGQAGSGQAGSGQAGTGGTATADAQCLCPDEPGYAPCVLPLMCCPCVAHCEDPATFNCSCTEVPTCQ